MGILEEELNEALNWRKLGAESIAIVDTSYLIDRSTESLWTILVEKALRNSRFFVSTDIQSEYEHARSSRAVDSYGVPKAPLPLDAIVLGSRTVIIDSSNIELPKEVTESAEIHLPDKGVIRDAVYIARETGKEVYLITNDTAIIRSFKGSELSRENICLLIPSRVKKDLSSLVQELGLQLLVRSKVLAQLYQLGLTGDVKGEKPYVVVERDQRVKYGSEVFAIDVATELAFVESSKSIPAATTMYGMQVEIASSYGQEELNKAFVSALPGLRGKKKQFVVIAAEHKFMPAIMRATKVPEIIRVEYSPRDIRKMLKRGTHANPIEWAHLNEYELSYFDVQIHNKN